MKNKAFIKLQGINTLHLEKIIGIEKVFLLQTPKKTTFW